MMDVSGNFIFDCLVGDCTATGGGGVSDLSALDDTLISSPTTGQSLNWNGTYWVNSTPTTGVTDHTLLTNIGTNTHAEIDNHIASGSVHFTEASIDHGSIAGLGDNDHPQYVLTTTNTALSSLVTSVETSTIDISCYIASNETAWSTDNDTIDHTLLTNI